MIVFMTHHDFTFSDKVDKFQHLSLCGNSVTGLIFFGAKHSDQFVHESDAFAVRVPARVVFKEVLKFIDL